jgi:outer membrane protein insertion porin family
MRILNIHSATKQLPVLLLAAALLSLAFSGPVSGQQAPAKALQLGHVEFMGLRRLTQEQALAISGLQTGDPFNEAAIDDAARKLNESGLFARLAYSVKSTGNQVQVTFQVEEADRALPAVFDNFVWFTEEEIITGIRREVPFFTGTVPQSGSTADAIANALQKLLDEKKIAGRIEHLSEDDLSHHLSYVFSVKGVDVPVCSLHFPGAAGVPEEELRKASKQLTERDYSKTSTAAFASIALMPIYRHVGRLRAQFNEPSAILEPTATPGCKGGVSLTIPVAEGEVYSWQKADWTGNQSLPSAELDAALGMKAGEVADGLKIDKGLKEVAKAYGHLGYISARVKQSTTFDETEHRVAFKMEVTEGPQYRMGELTIKGFSPEATAALREKWSLKPGDVFDARYVEDFFKDAGHSVVQKIFEERHAAPRIRTESKANLPALKVDVTLELAK